MRGTADEDALNRTAYTFQRETVEPTDTLSHGRGPMARYTGMIKSAFRPSDDACTYPFLVPANAMASVYLNRTASMIRAVYGAQDAAKESFALSLALRAQSMSSQIREAIYAHAITQDKEGRMIFAYEVDGYGGVAVMDDANLPSLLALPLLGFVGADDAIY